MQQPRIRKVLVVEADPLLLESYVQQLRDAGYAVVPAARLDTALCLAAAWRPDVAIIDMHLGPESGLDLLHALLERHAPRTILLASQPGYCDDFSTWFADAVFLKSPDLAPVVAKVQEFLAGEALDAHS